MPEFEEGMPGFEARADDEPGLEGCPMPGEDGGFDGVPPGEGEPVDADEEEVVPWSVRPGFAADWAVDERLGGVVGEFSKLAMSLSMPGGLR